MNKPTDADLDAMWSECDMGPEQEVHRRFARAVLARWGQPAHSGAQMLAFGRDCSDAAIAALRTQQPAPAGASYEKALEEALRERDDADDFIDALLDEVLGTDRAEWSSAYGRADALEEVRERITALHKPAVDRAWKQFEAATQQAEVRPVTPYTCPKCHALWLHWPAEQTGFGMDTLNCRSTTHCDYCEKGGVEQLERLERVPAALKAPQQEAQEPVGYTHASWIAEAKRGGGGSFVGRKNAAFDVPIYTAPPHSPAAQGDALDAEYQRGYRQGYEQRDAEVRGALV